MKQTNNAIKFLMAQYRAIFKNAYFKGMATALVLTAGLAAGQSQAADGNYWQYDGSTWSQVKDTPTETVNSKYTIVAGDYKNDSDTAPEGAQGNTATGGDLVLSNTDYNEHADFKTMTGKAVGGWASSTDGNAYAISNSVTVNAGGKVTITTQPPTAGEIYGGRASSTNGMAEASNNIVTIAKGTNADTVAAETGIFGGTAQAGAGATAASNQVIINKGNDTQAQKMGAVTKQNANMSRIVGGWVEAQSSTDSSGVFVARNNLVDIYNLSYTGAASDKGGYIGGGYVKLTKNDRKADTLRSENNQVILANSNIDNSSGSGSFSIFGEHVTTAADGTAGSVNTVSVAGDGSKVNLSITNSTLNNVEVYGGLATNKGSTDASGLVINLDATDLIGEQTAWGGHANSIWVNATTNTDATANNNTINITNSTDAENTKTVNSQIFGGIASIESASASSDFSKVTLTATGNKVNIDGNLKFTTATGEYYIAGAKAAQVSGSGATVTLSNNSVNFNATANGPANSSGSIVGALVTGAASDTATKISVLS